MRRLARLLLYVATAATVLGLGKLHARYIGFYSLRGSSELSWYAAYILLLCMAAYGVGLPDVPRNAYQALFSATVATIGAALAFSVMQLMVGSALLPRFVVFWSALLLVPVWTLTCFIAARDRRRKSHRDRVMAVLRPAEVDTLVRELSRFPEQPASVVWAMQPEDVRVVEPGSQPLVDAVMAAAATVLVLDRVAQADDELVAQAAVVHAAGVRIRTLSLFYDEWLGKLPLAELERVSIMFDIGEIHRLRYVRLKRLLDLLVALCLLPVLIAVTPLVIVGDLLANRGPLLFRQDRVGKGGDVFEIIKFRTMRAGADEGSWTAERDPRVTPFGRILRVSHVDELPQVVNIIRGNLSLVGPRPEQPHYVEQLTQKLPFYGVRHLVRPGLTGWAQVKYSYASSEIDAFEKLQYEFFYLRHQSLSLDLRILGRTLRSVIGLGGR